MAGQNKKIITDIEILKAQIAADQQSVAQLQKYLAYGLIGLVAGVIYAVIFALGLITSPLIVLGTLLFLPNLYMEIRGISDGFSGLPALTKFCKKLFIASLWLRSKLGNKDDNEKSKFEQRIAFLRKEFATEELEILELAEELKVKERFEDEKSEQVRLNKLIDKLYEEYFKKENHKDKVEADKLKAIKAQLDKLKDKLVIEEKDFALNATKIALIAATVANATGTMIFVGFGFYLYMLGTISIPVAIVIGLACGLIMFASSYAFNFARITGIVNDLAKSSKEKKTLAKDKRESFFKSLWIAIIGARSKYIVTNDKDKNLREELEVIETAQDAHGNTIATKVFSARYNREFDVVLVDNSYEITGLERTDYHPVTKRPFEVNAGTKNEIFTQNLTNTEKKVATVLSAFSGVIMTLVALGAIYGPGGMAAAMGAVIPIFNPALMVFGAVLLLPMIACQMIVAFGTYRKWLFQMRAMRDQQTAFYKSSLLWKGILRGVFAAVAIPTLLSLFITLPIPVLVMVGLLVGLHDMAYCSGQYRWDHDTKPIPLNQQLRFEERVKIMAPRLALGAIIAAAIGAFGFFALGFTVGAPLVGLFFGVFAVASILLSNPKNRNNRLYPEYEQRLNIINALKALKADKIENLSSADKALVLANMKARVAKIKAKIESNLPEIARQESFKNFSSDSYKPEALIKDIEELEASADIKARMDEIYEGMKRAGIVADTNDQALNDKYLDDKYSKILSVKVAKDKALEQAKKEAKNAIKAKQLSGWTEKLSGWWKVVSVAGRKHFMPNTPIGQWITAGIVAMTFGTTAFLMLNPFGIGAIAVAVTAGIVAASLIAVTGAFFYNKKPGRKYAIDDIATDSAENSMSESENSMSNTPDDEHVRKVEINKLARTIGDNFRIKASVMTALLAALGLGVAVSFALPFATPALAAMFAAISLAIPTGALAAVAGVLAMAAISGLVVLAYGFVGRLIERFCLREQLEEAQLGVSPSEFEDSWDMPGEKAKQRAQAQADMREAEDNRMKNSVGSSDSAGATDNNGPRTELDEEPQDRDVVDTTSVDLGPVIEALGSQTSLLMVGAAHNSKAYKATHLHHISTDDKKALSQLSECDATAVAPSA